MNPLCSGKSNPSLSGKTIHQAQSQRRKSLYSRLAIQSGSLSFPSSRTVGHGVDTSMNLQRCDVVLAGGAWQQDLIAFYPGGANLVLNFTTTNVVPCGLDMCGRASRARIPRELDRCSGFPLGYIRRAESCPVAALAPPAATQPRRRLE